ncbi:peptidoglycan DD-metalloendopeptidase family protein [Vibrio alfacsensis]|uniref:peptidoglycan DD-metalloendopeptidase family protein n=1 Tax=Vibrio alfacsensis TaxID=1074311 RepID=UPI001BEEDD9B|nr:peptidoglycan DD-metalloendopeptidase family protein [Vibrio alfacsensis]BBM66443.1 peptidase M23 [Vibrio alfacsensis]BCN25839.1 peptidase M23 [Vibrio alfacsensis]
MSTNEITAKRLPNLTSRKALLLYSLPVLVAIGISHSLQESSLTKTIALNLPESQVVEKILDAKMTDVVSPPNFEYQIQAGDNLSTIFSQLGFGYSSLMKVMETDLNFLALDTLKPGNTLRFWRDESTGELDKMELQFSIADKVVYQRNSDGSYDYSDISIPGVWHQEPLVGVVHGSFSSSAYRLGLTSAEISQVVNLLKEQVNFAKDLRAGDRFEVVRRAQSIDGVETGKNEIEAIKIYNRGREITAYLHSDGQFYNAKGESLQRAFQRYPVSKGWRISSNFNPKRLHPVTGRVAPHNGTDWAVPVGTPVEATGDGTVIMTRKHPYAGNYVVIEHGNKYKTRYLHLSKILVKKGQKVSRGQRIGLSGKTGRVTGPHLHYELIEYGRPVNAMRANIPMASSVPKKEMSSFVAKRDEMDHLLKEQEKAVL